MGPHREKSKPLHTEPKPEPRGLVDILLVRRSRMKSCSEKSRQRQVALDWENVTGWPTDPRELQGLRELLDLDIEQQFRNGLSRHLRSFYEAPGEQHSELDGQLTTEFDNFIVDQAPVLGARLLLSDLALLRILKWSLGAKDGICYLKKFTKALVKYAEIRFDDKARGDISEDWRRAKVDTMRELTVLQNEIKRDTVNHHRAPGLQDVEKSIRRSAEVYHSLSANLTSLLEFCRQHSATYSRFAEGRINPAPFFDEWAGWATNRDPESVRQKISGRK
jgi:hypothetical protein